MRRISIALAGTVAVCAVFVAASFPNQDPARQRTGNAYGDWLTANIGKAFDFYPDRGVAVEGAAGEFKLAMVGQDFVTFESKTEVVCVPVAVLRVVIKK